MEAQKKLRENFAGAASKNNVSNFNYNWGKVARSGFEKHKDVSYSPLENRNNIFERKMKQEVPRTRDQFVSSAFTQLLNPEIKKKVKEHDPYKHDKLDITDIKGTNVDTYGKYKNLEGRNYMDLNDIDKTKPNQLK